jgi:hypothetical protein
MKINDDFDIRVTFTRLDAQVAVVASAWALCKMLRASMKRIRSDEE